MYFTSSTSCEITSRKLMPQSFYWWSHQKHRLYISCYFRCLLENFKTEWQFHHKRVLWKRRREKENNITTSDYVLQNILPHQLKNTSAHHKVVRGCECCIYAKMMQSYLLTCLDIYLNKLKHHIQNNQNRKSDEIRIGLA